MLYRYYNLNVECKCIFNIGCIYMLNEPDPHDPSGKFCFQENGDYPSDCLKGNDK